MKLSLKNDNQTVASWRCTYAAKGATKKRSAKKEKLSESTFSLQNVFNLKARVRKRASVAGVLFGLLFLVAAIVTGFLIHNRKSFDLPYYLNYILPSAALLLALLLLFKKKKYLALTLCMKNVKEDLLSICFQRRDAQFNYLYPSYVYLRIDIKDSNSIVSKLGSILAKYDPQRNAQAVANGLPFGFPSFPMPAFPSINPYVLVLEEGKPEKQKKKRK